MTTRQSGLSAPDPAAAGHAGVLVEDVPAHHGLVIVERDLHWKPATFGPATVRWHGAQRGGIHVHVIVR
jgi:hypothetical protein